MQRVHATALARLYVCREGESTWKYNGLYGAVSIVTEADLRMACAHFIRLVDLGGFNPVILFVMFLCSFLSVHARIHRLFSNKSSMKGLTIPR